jgi:hypothetical protein
MVYRFTTNAFVSITVEAESEEETRLKMCQSPDWVIDRVHDENAELEDVFEAEQDAAS